MSEKNDDNQSNCNNSNSNEEIEASENDEEINNNFQNEDDEESSIERVPYTFHSDPWSNNSSVHRHRVEWVYPNDYHGPRHELGANSQCIESIEFENRENSESVALDYVVDPNDVEVTPTVEGIVVQRKRYFLKVCGFIVCDDNFPFLLDSKLSAFILVVLLIVGITSGMIQTKKLTSSSDHQNIDTTQPNEVMNEEPVIMDPRIANISQAILEVSGNVTLEENSSQNKALNWILHEDDLELNYNSSNLLQRYALMVFFYDLSGENWFRNTGYGSGKHECEWHGISCESGEVSVLKLNVNGLKGRIPNEISLFSRMDTLRLQGNLISGSIPSSIGQLDHLSKIRLDHNELTGIIPNEITKLRNVNDMRVNNNTLSGPIPEFDGNHRILHRMHLYGNKLSGTIPTSIGSLDSLEKLLLNSNHLVGTIPRELGNANWLNNLNLQNNKLTGEIPSSLSNLIDLRSMDLSNNLLSGTVPTNLYRHSKIQTLRLCNNVLTGTIPNISDLLPMAEVISLHNNFINGTIPQIIGNLPRLRLLKLHFSLLSGTVPGHLCDLQLESLTMDCDGKNPQVFCSCCTECF